MNEITYSLLVEKNPLIQIPPNIGLIYYHQHEFYKIHGAIYSVLSNFPIPENYEPKSLVRLSSFESLPDDIQERISQIKNQVQVFTSAPK